MLPWIILIIMFALLITQLGLGVVFNGAWKPWYRRDTQPKQFWAVLIVQFLMLMIIGLIWVSISLSK